MILLKNLKNQPAQLLRQTHLRFHLAPPLLARRNDKGELVKREYGAWMLTVFKLIAPLRRLRGSVFDVFGRTAERRMERQLIEDYQQTIDAVLADLTADKLDLAARIAAVPEHIRGFGHVKERHLAAALASQSQLLAQFRLPASERAGLAA